MTETSCAPVELEASLSHRVAMAEPEASLSLAMVMAELVANLGLEMAMARTMVMVELVANFPLCCGFQGACALHCHGRRLAGALHS